MKLLGNHTTLENFKKDLENARLPHAFIIEGAEGSGKLTLARTLSSMLICKKSPNSCLICPDCIRVLNGTHPDVFEILHREKTGQIKIDDVRLIIERSHIKPSEAEYKVFIVDNAQTMNLAAQNALLQVFEEPPPKTVFFLLTTDRNLLLKTLLSRGIILKTENLPNDVIENFLIEKYPDKKDFISKAIKLSGGAIGATEIFLSENSSVQMLSLVTEYMDNVAQGASLFTLSKFFSPFKVWAREDFISALGYFSLALRDISLCTTKSEVPLIFFDDKTVAEKISEKLGLKNTVKAFDVCADMIKRANTINLACAISRLNTFFASDI